MNIILKNCDKISLEYDGLKVYNVLESSFIVLNLLKEDEKYIETTLSFTETVRLREGLDKLIKNYCEYMNED